MGQRIKRDKRRQFERPGDSKRTFLRLISYLSDYKGHILLMFILVVISVASSLVGSYMIRPIINDYIIPGDIRGLIITLCILVAIYVVGAFATYILYKLLIKIGQRVTSHLRGELFTKMERLPVRYFDTNQHGDLMSRFTNDMDRISEVLTDHLADIFTAGLTLLGIFGVMIYISPILTIVTLLTVPLMMLFTRMVARKSRKYFSAQQDSMGQVNGYIEEMISGQRVVRLFGYEKEVIKEFEGLNMELRDGSQKAQLYSGMMMPIMHNLNTLNFVVITIVGALLTIFRGFDIGGLAAFLQYSRQFGRPINDLATLYNNIQAAIAGAERIFQILDEDPEVQDIPDAIEIKRAAGDICMKDVCFEYESGKPVLKSISFHAKPGEKIALVGTTGAGKTTIFNMLPRFYDILSGEIRIDNIPIRDIKRDDLRDMLAMVLQDTHLFTGTVMENIRFGNLAASDERVIEAARLTRAHSFIKRLPQGYNTMLENDGENLSQGQRQLLNITRAAVSDPYILLLDEATSNIDTRSEILIQKGLDKLMEGRTSLIIAHRLSTIRNADRIMVMEDGRIVESGTHDELITMRGQYHKLYQRTI